MAALMTSEMGDTDKVIKNLAECREKGIEVLAPDINESRSDFTPVGSKVRFGLAAVKSVGEKAVEVILESRRRDGPFQSLFDFCRRVDLTAVNRRVVENLINCGAFDSTQVSRARMIGALDEAIRAGQAYQRDQASNQIDIFSLLGTPGKGPNRPGDVYPQVKEWSQQELLAFEKEALGFYITGHPLDKYDRVIKRIISGTAAGIKERPVAGEVKLAGVVSALKLRNTKKGDRYGSFNLEDKTGFLEVIAWPEIYKKSAELLGSDDPIFIKGKLEVGEDRMQIIANEIIQLTAAAAKVRALGTGKPHRNGSSERVHLYVRESEISAQELVQLREALLNCPGSSTVVLHLVAEDPNETVIELPDQIRVAPGPELGAIVSKLFGPRVSFRSLAS
jgi:DNA polymerase-3 subunit alpha